MQEIRLDSRQARGVKERVGSGGKGFSFSFAALPPEPPHPSRMRVHARTERRGGLCLAAFD
eukprot:6941735-Alexandrium_andersonii.AAC.1